MSEPDEHGPSEPPVHTGADDVHAHPRHTGHRTFDLIMAISAIFISLVSLAVAIEHGRTERDLVAASNWPFLDLDESDAHGAGGDIALGVTNAGVGPAKIRSFEMMLDGKPVTSPGDLLARCCGLSRDAASLRIMVPPGADMTSVVADTVLRPGDTNDVLILSRKKADKSVFEKFDRVLLDDRLRFRTCYCSSLDQCWIGDLVHLDTKPVNACPAPANPYDFNRWLADR